MMQKKENKRKTILEKAVECFTRYGYDKTTLDDIGKACHLNKASLYYYYKNKEQIFLNVLQNEAMDYVNAIDEKILKIKDPEKRILKLMDFRLENYQKILNLHKLSIENLHVINDKFKSELERLEQLEQNVIEVALKEFYKGKDVVKIARSIMLIANGIKHEYLRTADTLFAYEVDYSEVRKEVEYAVQLILKGIK